MSLEVLDRLGVPAKHPICREALMAWWFVPSKHEQEFFRVLEHVWTRIVTPRMASLIFAHFRTVVSKRDYPYFHEHMLAILQSLA